MPKHSRIPSPLYKKITRPLIMGVSVCRKTSIVIKKWGLGRSPKQGEGGSPTLSPFPRGRGLGIGIINLQFVLNTNFKSGRLPLCKYIQVLLQYLLYIPTAPVAIQQFQPSFQHFLFIIIFLHKPYIRFLLTFHKHFRTTNLQYLTSPSKCREKSLQNLSVLVIV